MIIPCIGSARVTGPSGSHFFNFIGTCASMLCACICPYLLHLGVHGSPWDNMHALAVTEPLVGKQCGDRNGQETTSASECLQTGKPLLTVYLDKPVRASICRVRIIGTVQFLQLLSAILLNQNR